jgi:predicted esterase
MLREEAQVPQSVRYFQFAIQRVYVFKVCASFHHRWILSLLALVAAPIVVALPAGDSVVTPGKIVPRVLCAARPEQSYALYLPSRYTVQKRWPLIYIFDPDARGKVPTQIIKDAAEQYGYILATSNNSKNGPLRPEMEAASAMWDDTHARLSIDDQRIYTAGFSGGARLASRIAQTCECAHGVFLSGAGFGVGSPPTRDGAFPVFLTTGFLDFNYNELVRLDGQLSSLDVPHFLRRFDGSHEWAPADVWPEALGWMTLQAMKDGRAPREEAFIATELQRFTAAAKEIEKSGNLFYAAAAYRQVAAAFDRIAPIDALRERAAELEKNPWYRSDAKREREDLTTQSSLESEILRVTGGLREFVGDRRQLQQQASQLIADLRNRCQHEKKEDKKRVLERARRGIFASLIETGEPLIDEKQFSAAQAYLELAVEARPEVPWPHLSLARCFLIMGKKKEALQSLQRAKDAGLKAQNLADLEREIPEFAAIASDPGFQKLVEGKQPSPAEAP